ncbi:hypothetical protein FRB96_005459 [Tulasnella sp. 330]|nr:hypothetical protein FRB96_005459 [Tulasnella sp. 330]KAG8888322.1 hypothetical protein FRB98_007980 [Tulasnella sp. 332]
MDQGLDELIQELSRGGTLLDGVVAWRFPELKEFRVHSSVDYDPELLLSMARARTEAATCLRGGEVVAGGRPTLLERLEISALDKLMDQETWEETKATLGEGAIWNRAPHLGEVPETIGL